MVTREVTDPDEPTESMEARLAKLELQVERLFVELVRLRSAMGSMVSGDGEALTPDP